MKKWSKFLITLTLLLVVKPIFAQGFETIFHLSVQDSLTAGPGFNSTRFTNSTEEQELEIKKELLYWRGQSFLSANVDSVWSIVNQKHVKLYIGNAIPLAYLTFEDIPEEILYTIGYNPKLLKNELASQKTISLYTKRILTYYENHGYPFAQLLVNQVQNSSEGLKITYRLDKYKKQIFDSIRIVGTAKVSPTFLENFLQIVEGEDYNESLVRQMDRKLKTLAFLQLTQATELYFSNDKAHLIIHADKRKSDKINGLIGFAPNSENKNKGVLITGEFDLELHNLFQSAKEFSLNWKSFLERSQKLHVGAGIPFIFSSPLGIQGEFNLFKSDTLFLNLNSKLAVNYLISSGDKLSMFYENQSTSLITVDTAQIRQQKRLPSTNSVRTNYYGLDFFRSRLDYPFNPRKGLQVYLKGAMGFKSIQKDSRIAKIKYNENGVITTLYDSIKLKFNQYNLATKVDYFIPLGRSSTFLMSANVETLIADKIYVNEQIRLGGFSSLRGFDEESLFATSYGLINLEYRYLLGLNSYLQLFWNGAYIQNKVEENTGPEEDTPFGFGAGISFETNGGIFNIAYAIGKQQNNPIEFKTAKVHFGLTGYF